MAKVLIVDDEADAREFVRAILEPDGWEIHEAADGVAGLAMAKQEKPDLIVLDVQMPKQDGFVTFGELIKDPDTAGCKVVMLTGVGQRMGIKFDSDAMGDYLGKEPDAYVEKPIDPDTFKRVIEQVSGA